MAAFLKAERKTVLFVDDDAQFLETIQELARRSRSDWDILSAPTTALALALLQAHHVALIVLDWRMPVIDGLQFLQLIQPSQTHLKKIILSAFLDDAARVAAEEVGAELVLDKPLTPDGFHFLLAACGELLGENSESFHPESTGMENVIHGEVQSAVAADDGITTPVPGVLEMVVSTDSGELLHAWQSEDPHSRCAAVLALQDFSERLRALLPVGPLERVEFFCQPERVVARLTSHGGVFVRGTVPSS
jgi:CheY-like chemotaxis protein